MKHTPARTPTPTRTHTHTPFATAQTDPAKNVWTRGYLIPTNMSPLRKAKKQLPRMCVIFQYKV